MLNINRLPFYLLWSIQYLLKVDYFCAFRLCRKNEETIPKCCQTYNQCGNLPQNRVFMKFDSIIFTSLFCVFFNLPHYKLNVPFHWITIEDVNNKCLWSTTASTPHQVTGLVNALIVCMSIKYTTKLFEIIHKHNIYNTWVPPHDAPMNWVLI